MEDWKNGIRYTLKPVPRILFATQLADENPGISEYNAQYINRHLYSGLLIPTNLFKQVDDEDICVPGLIVVVESAVIIALICHQTTTFWHEQ